MKIYRFHYGIMFAILTTFVFVSCEDDDSDSTITPVITTSESSYDVDYTAGEIDVDFTSNVIFYASVDSDAQNWLSYEFQDSCQTFIIDYDENDTTIERSGYIILSKSDVADTITINQDGNPNASNGSEQSIDLDYTVDTSTGYTILTMTADVCDEIPIGSTVTLECGDDGTISIIDDTYSEYLGGSPSNGTFSFVWTQDVADYTATSGLTAILRDDFSITAASATYATSNIDFTTDDSSGYNILTVDADNCSDVVVGAYVVFECSSDDGSITIMDPDTYSTLASGSPENGKFSFVVTDDILDIIEDGGIYGILRDDCDLSSIYSNYIYTDIEYTITASSSYTIMSIAEEECANIPIGATVVIECSSDDGSISFLDSSYSSIFDEDLTPEDGEITFEWTQAIEETYASGGITTAILRDDIDITGIYCRN